MLEWVKWLFKSKKCTAAIVAVLFAILSPSLSKLGVDVTSEQIGLVVGAISAYILGQGLADLGKEAPPGEE